MSEVSEINKIDLENDTLTVIRAKVDAMAKALRKRAQDNPKEADEINSIFESFSK